MKKILAVIAAVASIIFAGCDKMPSEATMETTATAVGKAAGYVANQTKIDDKSRTVVIEIMTKAQTVVPSSGQSFADAWTPIAKEITDKLVAEGKIDAAQSLLINGAFSVAVKGIDYIFTVRYPKAGKYNELVAAAARGFTGGFLTVFTPSNAAVSKSAPSDYDKEAYEYLLSTVENKK